MAMLRWSAPLVLLDADMEPMLADLVIHRLIRGAGDSKLKPVVLLELVAGRAHEHGAMPMDSG